MPTGVEEVTSDVRLAGWPFSYNVAFVNILDAKSESLYEPPNSFELYRVQWLAASADALIASLAVLTVFFMIRRYARKTRSADSKSPIVH